MVPGTGEAAQPLMDEDDTTVLVHYVQPIRAQSHLWLTMMTTAQPVLDVHGIAFAETREIMMTSSVSVPTAPEARAQCPSRRSTRRCAGPISA